MQFDASELKGMMPSYSNNGKRSNNRGQNNNKKNKNNQNNRKNDDNRRSGNTPSAILNSGMDFDRGDGERTFDELNAVEDSPVAGNVPEEVADGDNILTVFLDDYAELCKQSGNQVIDMIRDEFWDVCKVMTHYYEPKYSSILGKMNGVLDVVKTQRFVVALSHLLNTEDIDGWNDGANDIWKAVMFVISTVITTCHKSMKDETISAYIELLSSQGLSGKDIDRLEKELAITKDLALDLIAAIPVIPQDMTDITLKQFYGVFVMKLMDHAEENIDVLDRGTQGKLFTFFFGKDHIALKAIGRMLAAPKIVKFENEAQKLIYAEYLSMLSDRLDAYDIKDIKYVLKFIVNEKKRIGKDESMLFGSVMIVDYNSIRKAEFELINSDSEAKEYLIKQ